jgi:hypothetical protein
MPICFVFKPGVLDAQLRRVFPFDTGAAHNGIFSPHIDPAKLAEFQLAPTVVSIKKAVTAFFNTNEAYFTASPNPALAALGVTGLNSLDCYCSLITEDGETGYDDRRGAIEAQTTAPISLKDTLLSVVLPTPFLDDDGVRDAIVNQWRAYPLRYNHIRGTVPSEYIRLIAEKVREFLVNGGYF